MVCRMSITSVANDPSKMVFLDVSIFRKPFALALLSEDTPLPVAIDNNKNNH